MKKFHFSLENVLKYKNQILDSLKMEHAILLDKVRSQEKLIERMQQEYESYNQKLNEKNATGITTIELRQYKQYLHTLEDKIKKQFVFLEEIKIKEQEKKEQVVEIKIETASFDKLKEKRLMEYRKVEQKEEELRVDEMISNKMYCQKIQ